MEKFVKAFEEYCSVPGVKSNKPGSYAKGIQYLCEYLKISEINEESVKKIKEIKEYVGDRNSAFYRGLLTFLEKRNRKSYLKNGFIQAALKYFFDYIKEMPVSKGGGIRDWWPSTEEYPLNLTKDDWKKYILEIELPNHPSPMKMLKGMMELGGEASCKQLSETYGGHPTVYIGCAMNLGRRVKKYFDLPPCMEGKQERYFALPYVGKYTSGSGDNYTYRIRPELYEALNEIDLSGIDPQYGGGEKQLSTKELLQNINAYIAAKGFSFDEGLVENFYLSLKSKPFVILAGTSGTGKTRLVRLFAEAIGAYDDKRYLQVAVKPDWSDSTDLFGHVNLDNEFVKGAIIDFIHKAANDKSDLPYILCLDEMNLARVEYYLSDFLSVIETRDWDEDNIKTDPLVPTICYSGNAKAKKEYSELIFPENLYIVGTVNMDETTFPFSKKVLDRANTIEFSYVDFTLPEVVENKEADIVPVQNSFLRADFLRLTKDCTEQWETVVKNNKKLADLNEILKSGDLHFGYRMRDEIIFYMLYREKADLLSENEAFDNQIMQKILPRIQGSSESIASILRELFKECAGPFANKNGSSDSMKMENYLKDGAGVKYPRSAEKIWKMLRRFEDDDFTSYWV